MILGAVLAGGRSARFGSDKALAVWNDMPLIDHVIARLGSIASLVIVCGRQHAGAISVPDRPGPDMGPLGGLSAALHYGAAHGFERIVTAPCDTPLLPDDLLAALGGAERDMVLADMPVIGCWRSAGASLLDEHLARDNRRSVQGWADVVGAVRLPGSAPPNINRPSDLGSLATAPQFGTPPRHR